MVKVMGKVKLATPAFYTFQRPRALNQPCHWPGLVRIVETLCAVLLVYTQPFDTSIQFMRHATQPRPNHDHFPVKRTNGYISWSSTLSNLQN